MMVSQREQTDTLESGTPRQNCRVVESRHAAPQPAGIVLVALIAEAWRARLIENQVAIYEIGTRSIDRVYGAFDLVRRQPIVAVEELHKSPAGQRDALIKGIADAAVGLAYPKILWPQLFGKQLGRTVG